ncbi:glycosyltransferase family 2 protein [Candidatus Woesearchaeota archaeon]|nr:glycosyltransferase family 2 protein [Candidatus Woesearchaeota archaeon]
MKTFVIIPAYNEERFIQDLVRETKKHTDYIIVVDDGSSDLTYERAEDADLVLRHPVNMGKGLAMSTGMHAALERGAKIIIFMDADGQHDPKDINKLVSKLENEKLDLVTGIREFNQNMPFIFRFGNTSLVRIFNFLFKSNVSDLSNGYRAMTYEAAQKIRWQSPGYGVETEMLANAAKHNLKIGEIPIETKYLDSYKGTTVFDGIKIFINMLIWRFKQWQ